MSLSLVWTLVPVEPEVVGSAMHPLKGVVCDFLGIDTRDPVRVATGDAFHTFLRGYVRGLPAGDDRDAASGLLADLAARGELLLALGD